MSMKKIIPVALALAIAGVGIGGYAMAESGKNDAAEQAAIASAKVSLSQAMQAAETKTGGKAISSGVENENGKVLGYDVEVRLADGTVKKVIVDMQSGQVTKVMADNEDDESGERNENEER